MFPVDNTLMQAVRDRVSLARKVDKAVNTSARAKSSKDWFSKTAKELDIELDDLLLDSDDEDDGEGTKFIKNRKEENHRAEQKDQLSNLLSKPLRVNTIGAKSSFLTPQTAMAKAAGTDGTETARDVFARGKRADGSGKKPKEKDWSQTKYVPTSRVPAALR